MQLTKSINRDTIALCQQQYVSRFIVFVSCITKYQQHDVSRFIDLVSCID
jgi:hypothetical protein